GVRYILPALVPLALLAGAGIDLLAVRSRNIIAALALVLGLAGYLGWTCVRVQPYDLDYFNEVVGGAGGVQRRHWFEVGWWGEGLAEAVDYVNARAAKDATIARLVYPTHVTWLREDLWQKMVESPAAPADWYLVNDQWELEHGAFAPPAG